MQLSRLQTQRAPPTASRCRPFLGVFALAIITAAMVVRWHRTSEALGMGTTAAERREMKLQAGKPKFLHDSNTTSTHNSNIDPHQVQLCMFSDRVDSAYAAIRSVCNNTAVPSALRFLLVVPKKGSLIRMIPQLQQACPESSINVYTMEELTERIIELGMVPVWKWHFADGTKDRNKYPWAVHLAQWDYSPKHISAFNHIRFYIPLIEPFKSLKRILFLDDDIVIQGDVRLPWEHQLQPGKVISASCQNWLWWKECGEFRSFMNATYLETPYLGWGEIDSTRSIRDATCKSDDQEHCMPNGLIEFMANWTQTTLGVEHVVDLNLLKATLAWNFGFNVFDLELWRQTGLTDRYIRWMEFNKDHAVFAPTSLAFGLGIPFLAMMGTVECMDDLFPVVQGLGFVPQSVLSRNGYDPQSFPRQFGFHFNGDDKPWDPTNKLPEYTHLYLPYASPKIQDVFRQAKTKHMSHEGTLSSFLLLTEPLSGSDLFLDVLSKHPRICSSGGWSRESFSPLYLTGGRKPFDAGAPVCRGYRNCLWSRLNEYSVIALQKGWCIDSPRTISREASEYLGPDAEPMCRLLKSIITQEELVSAYNTSDYYAMGDSVPKVWSSYFTWVMRDQLVRSAHESPTTSHGMEELMDCKCPEGSTVVGMKVMVDWVGTRLELLEQQGPGYPYGLNLEAHIPSLPPGHFYYPLFSDAERLGTKIIFLKRRNIVRSFASQERRKQVPQCRSRKKDDVRVCRSTQVSLDPKHFKDHVKWRLHARDVASTLMSRHNLTVLHLTYEECASNQDECFNRVADFLGVHREEHLHMKGSWVYEDNNLQPLEDIIANVPQAKDVLKKTNLLHLWFN